MWVHTGITIKKPRITLDLNKMYEIALLTTFVYTGYPYFRHLVNTYGSKVTCTKVGKARSLLLIGGF